MYEDGPCGGMATLMQQYCGNQTRQQDGETCAFSVDNAEACLEGVWTCDGESGQIERPTACDEVLVCSD
jgi:hypothetical protein